MRIPSLPKNRATATGWTSFFHGKLSPERRRGVWPGNPQNTAFFRIFPPFLRILPAKLMLVVGLWPEATRPYNGTSVFHAKSLFVPWGAC